MALLSGFNFVFYINGTSLNPTGRRLNSAFPFFVCLVCKYEDNAALKTPDVWIYALRTSLQDVCLQTIKAYRRTGCITPLIN